MGGGEKHPTPTSPTNKPATTVDNADNRHFGEYKTQPVRFTPLAIAGITST
jgi:hypothetical protein